MTTQASSDGDGGGVLLDSNNNNGTTTTATTGRRRLVGGRAKAVVKTTISTFSLVIGLCMIIAAQLILFPLVFTWFVHDPYNTHGSGALSSSSSSGALLQLPEFGTYTSSSYSSSTSSPGNRKKRPLSYHPGSPDGTFNGVPVWLRRKANFRSKVHCVGENYRDDAWRYRSCRFQYLCFNTTSKNYQIYQSHNERLLSVYLAQRKHMHSSTTMLRFGANNTNAVSIGGINQKWNEDGIERLKWFPRVVHVPNYTDEIPFYELPPDTVMIPFHSFNGANPGHLVWDDFLPIYTLLQMFQLEDRELLLLRYVLQDGERGLWASCDLRPEKTEECRAIMSKFMPLMVGGGGESSSNSNNNRARAKFTSTQDFEFQTSSGQPPVSDLVCSKSAAAGIGALTDHGAIKSHGWEVDDYKLTHNHGRGGALYYFRNFMVSNLGLATETKLSTPHRIVFSQKSSDIFIRSLDFAREIKLTKESFPLEQVENYTFSKLSIQEQVEIASQTSIYVSLCGGGAVTAMFLPRGSSVILYYGEDSGTSNNKLTGTPALLDWDLFNSMSHLRVHWLPRNSMGKGVDEKALILLIQQELSIMQSHAFD